MRTIGRWPPRVLACLALAGCWIIFFAPALPGSNVLLERDLIQTALPWRQFMIERLRSGHLPQWYPLDSLGAPFLAQIVTAVFHPQTLLYFLLAPVVALKWNVLVAYAVALAGAYRAGRAFAVSRPAAVAGAVVFGFGGYAQGIYYNPPYLVGLATLPWVLWAGARLCVRLRSSDAALLGVVWALVLLGGDAQSFILVPLILLIPIIDAGLRRRTALLLLAAGGIAFLVSCASLLPALASLADSARSSWVGGGTQGVAWALHWRRLPEFLIPGYIPADWKGSMGVLLLGGRVGTWSESIFLGGVALLLALLGISRRRASWALAAIALLALLLALGDHGLLPIAWRLFPPLAKFRFPEKYLALLWVMLPPLVALGFDRVRAAPQRFMPLALSGMVVCFSVALLARSGWLVQTIAAGVPLRPDFAEELRRAWTQGAGVTGGMVACFAILLVLMSRDRRWAVGLAALVFIELWRGNGAVVALAPIEAATQSIDLAAPVLAAAPRNGPPPRVRTNAPMLNVSALDPAVEELRALYTREVAVPDAGALDGIPSMGSALPGLGARDEQVLTPLSYEPGRFDGLLNGCFEVEQPKPGLDFAARSAMFDLVLVRKPCRPRAFLADARSMPDSRAALEAMRLGLAANELVWEGGPPINGARGVVEWSSYEPEHLVLDVQAESRGALAVSDSLRAGWSATIDGRPAPIHFTNVAVRGVAVDAGHHRVEFSYRTPGLRLGLALSLVGLILAAAMGFIGRYRSARSLVAAN